MECRQLLDRLGDQRDAMVDRLRGWVEHESPSRDVTALNALSSRLAAMLEEAGGQTLALPDREGRVHLLARFPGERPDAHALVLGHFDTVWPLGTLERMPFRREGERVHGPGTFDMKASLVLIEFALKALRAQGAMPPRPVLVLLTADEEIGSPGSRELIEAHARGAAYALVLESPLPGGRLKTARKGVGGFTIEVAGRAAHAGIEPEKGASAIVELAHQVLGVAALANPAAGTTVNVGVIHGGSAANVVAAHATAQVDVRVATEAEARRISTAMAERKPVTPGTRVTVTGAFKRPPMERTPAIADLFGQARRLAAELGLDLTEGSTGGASDGNFTAALGVPTLDGLGALGDGAHADHEHVLIDSLPQRAALLAALLLGL